MRMGRAARKLKRFLGGEEEAKVLSGNAERGQQSFVQMRAGRRRANISRLMHRASCNTGRRVVIVQKEGISRRYYVRIDN
jgi:hypothetical protein